MLKISRLFFAFLLLTILAAGFLSAQTKESATVQGTIKDDTGTPLPGVTVTASSPSVMGKPSAISNKEGHYRIPALSTGIYTIEATLGGFAPAKIVGVSIHVGMTATVNLAMSQANVEAEVYVIGAAPVVDVTNSSLANTYISKEMLTSLPTAQNTYQIMNLAPGVTEWSAFGAGELTGNSWTLDGAEVSSAWFGGGMYTSAIDYNVVEETQIIALGAPAEYGGFTGSAVNIVTKSGGNDLSGDGQFLGSGESWHSTNITKGDPKWILLPETPITNLIDTSVHLGGPILKDKIWFFAGFSYYKTTTKSISSGKVSPTTLPKYFFKLTFLPTKSDRIQAFFNRHESTQIQAMLSALVHPEANADCLWSETIANLSYLHTFSATSIIEMKFAGSWGTWVSIPSSRNRDIAGHFDLATGEYYENAYWWADQPDHKVNLRTTFSHAVDNLAGSHDFKVGAEVEQSGGVWDMTINGDVAYFDLDHQPYMAYTEHGRQGFSNLLYSFYLQDDWRLTDSVVINPGIRYNIARGKVPGLDQVVWKPHMGLEPRIGVVWDIFKNQKTVFKAHYGKYYEGTRAYNFWYMTPQGDKTYYLVPEWGTLNYWYTVYGENLYSVDPNIKNPSMNQAVVGIEQILGNNLSATASFIYKKWGDFVDMVDLAATFKEVPFMDPATGKVYTVYSQTNVGTTPHYLITNPKVGADIGAAYPGIVKVDPSRKYVGFQLTLKKRFADNWQLSASYTYSKEEGSYSNTHTATGLYGVGQTGNYFDPTLQINLYGRSTVSPPHVFKIMATYMLPWDINLGAFYNYNSGRTWTKTIAVTTVAQATVPYLLLEPQGSERMPDVNNLDLRVEKSFRYRKMRLSLMVDIFNVFNQGRATFVDVFEGSTQGLPLEVCPPRTLRAGVRFIF